MKQDLIAFQQVITVANERGQKSTRKRFKISSLTFTQLLNISELFHQWITTSFFVLLYIKVIKKKTNMFLKECQINCMRTALLKRSNSRIFSIFCQISQLSHNIIEKFWKSVEGEDFYVGLVMIRNVVKKHLQASCTLTCLLEPKIMKYAKTGFDQHDICKIHNSMYIKR